MLAPGDLDPLLVNDVHSRLNRTRVAEIVAPRDVGELQAAVRRASDRGVAVSVCGGRHAMGGQQFGERTMLVDTSSMHRVVAGDPANGLLELEAGIRWPEVVRSTRALAARDGAGWGIRQKQTGADDLALGGAVSANVHGRGLRMGPIVEDVESIRIVDAHGELVECSRAREPELFSLVVGGYGLFGIVATVTLRLAPRRKLRRLVEVLDIERAMRAVRRRIADGCLYGDFQYAIDPADDSFLRRGVFACYEPVPEETEVSDASADLRPDDWIRLLKLAHTDKRKGFESYSAHYLATHGRVYWSDTMQLSTYVPSYGEFLKADATVPSAAGADESLMIGELYVAPDALLEFLAAARSVLRATGVEDIYGTIRSILADTTTFLPWARRDSACVVFNLRVRHDAAGIERTARAFRGLHDAAIAHGGSFFLTYHRFATRAQIEACYPRFEEFLARKRRYDPDERFQSEWYRHHKAMFA
jgi:FAD/FMN-containing dehydrogenase